MIDLSNLYRLQDDVIRIEEGLRDAEEEIDDAMSSVGDLRIDLLAAITELEEQDAS